MKNKKILEIIVAALIVLIMGVIVIRSITAEDSWICKNRQWVKHGNPSVPMPPSPCP